MKAGDKVVVLSGAWKWMLEHGWSAPKSFTIDGKTALLLSVNGCFCNVKIKNLAFLIDMPRGSLSPVGISAGENEVGSEREKAILLQAIEHYGVKNQAAQLMGEMGELTAELTRHFFQNRDRKKKIEEEIADVQIMLEQMILHLGIEKEVAEWRSNKLERLESRMNQAG